MDFSETMDGRQIRGTAFLLLVVSISCNLGCSAVWREVPASVAPASKVSLDASWFLENPSKEVVNRFTSDRQEHIAEVMSNRQKGVVGISLDEAVQGNSGPSAHIDAFSSDASATASNTEKDLTATEINSVPTVVNNGSGRLTLKVKGGTEYVR